MNIQVKTSEKKEVLKFLEMTLEALSSKERPTIEASIDYTNGVYEVEVVSGIEVSD